MTFLFIHLSFFLLSFALFRLFWFIVLFSFFFYSLDYGCFICIQGASMRYDRRRLDRQTNEVTSDDYASSRVHHCINNVFNKGAWQKNHGQDYSIYNSYSRPCVVNPQSKTGKEIQPEETDNDISHWLFSLLITSYKNLLEISPTQAVFQGA